MTLRELWMLVVRYWILVLAIVVVCTLLGFGYATVKDSKISYNATAQIAAGSNVNSVAGFAENVKRDMLPDLQSRNISVDISSKSTVMMVIVSASGPDQQACIEAANSIANAANDIATEAYSQSTQPYSGNVSAAVDASVVSAKSIKFLALGFVGGVVVALVVVVLIDLRKKSVKTAESARALTHLPILEVIPAPTGDKLLTNVRFAVSRFGESKESLSVLVIPVGRSAAAEEVVSLLKGAAVSESLAGFTVKQAEPLSKSMAAAYAAKDVDAVVVVVEQWKDSLPALVSCVDELQFAEAKIAGLAFCKEFKRRAA